MPERIRIVFLGTGSVAPTPERNHTGILFTYKDENILIDCGENIQRQFKIAGLNAFKLTRIFLTHWHGDHVLGLGGLLQSLALGKYSKTLEIYGPRGTKKFMKNLLNMFIFVDKINMKVIEIEKEGNFLETKDLIFKCKKLVHSTFSLGYSVIEKDKLRISKEFLNKNKIKESQELGKLVEGKDIKINGKIIRAKDATFLEKGRKITIILDTGYMLNISKFAENSDLLITECSFCDESKEKAKECFHLTAKQAAEIAKNSRSTSLILTHIGQRYQKHINFISEEAKKYSKTQKSQKILWKFCYKTYRKH